MSSVIDTLPPVKVTLRGKYWDSQIYSGNLVLFGLDGSIVRLDWNRFVDSLPLEEGLRLVAEAALLGSDRFYGSDVRRLIQDPEVKPIIVEKFRRLHVASNAWDFDISQSGRRTDNPLPFPHNDSDYYYGSLYVGARSGVFQLVGDSEGARHLGKRQLTDAPALDIATKHSTIAIAAGNEGLIEVHLHKKHLTTTLPIAANSCNVCEWSYASLVCSDHFHSLFIANFDRVRQKIEGDPRRSYQYTRRFTGVVTDQTLFGSPHSDAVETTIQWGAKDRIYRYHAGAIESVYSRAREKGRVSFERRGQRHATENFDLDEFVGVRVAPFGSILEFDSQVVVLLNSGEVLTFPGEPVNWRVFPRSLNYLNHLHIIYEDRIEIVAFTNDYFTSPEERFFGTEPMSSDDGEQAIL